MFVLADTENQGAIIKVVGVGGGGGNAVTHMVGSGIEGVISSASTRCAGAQALEGEDEPADRLDTSPRASAPAPTPRLAAGSDGRS